MKTPNFVPLIGKTFNSWQQDNCLRLSAALSYYSIFSIAPLLVIAISMAGLFLGPKAAQDQIHEQLQNYVGSQTAESVQTLIQSAYQPQKGHLGAAIGIVTLIIGAAGVFGQLKDSLNTIWKVQQKPGGGVKSFLRNNLLSFGMILVIGFLLLVSLLLTAAVSGASAFFGRILNLPPTFWSLVTSVASWAIVTVLFAAIFRVLPDARIKWRNVWVGAAVTAVLFEIGKFALGWYLGRPSTVSAYGAAGSVVLLLLWVYYASLILFFGAEFTRVYSEAAGEAIIPAENAEMVNCAALLPANAAAVPTPHKEYPSQVFGALEIEPKVGNPLPQPETGIQAILRMMMAALSVGASLGVALRWRERHDKGQPASAGKALQHDLHRLLDEGRSALRDRLHRH